VDKARSGGLFYFGQFPSQFLRRYSGEE